LIWSRSRQQAKLFPFPADCDSIFDDGVVNFLLPGDIEKKVENELVAQDAPLKSDFAEGSASRQQDFFA
jgi:hypothetical protein